MIKLVTLPFDDLLDQVVAAQVLMLAFYAGAAVLAYWSLCRLVPSRWIALTAVLAVFSSLIMMQHSWAVVTDVGPGFFSFVLVFHGMVVFAQEGRFRQLAVKLCVALLLDWHVLALLFVFVVLGLIKEIIRVHGAETFREIVVAVVSSRYFVLGSVALGFSLLVLAYNLGVEYYALNAGGAPQTTLSDLPSVRSMLIRTSIAEGATGDRPWSLFLSKQIRWLGQTVVPFALADVVLPLGNSFVHFVEPFFAYMNVGWMIKSSEFYLGILVVGACTVGVFGVRHRLLAATAVLSGFCWAIPMRQNVYHTYETLFYVGVSLSFCTLLMLVVRKLIGDRFMPFAAGAGLLVFAVSSYQIGRIEYSNGSSTELRRTIVDDFDAIRTFIKGKNVFISATPDKWVYGNWLGDLEFNGADVEFDGSYFGLHYFLSGSRILFNDFGCDRSLDWADFIVSSRQYKGPGLLTPDNEVVFLYDRHIRERHVDGLVDDGILMLEGDFDVYLTGDRKLVYVSDRCDGADSLFLGVPISLSIYPLDAADAPDPAAGHEFRELAYVEHFVMDTSRHVVIFDLPDYGVARIVTGQYGDGGRIWGGSLLGPDYAVDADLMALADRAAAAGGPVARGRFNVYITDGSLVYVKEPCRGADVDDGFFVHVVPADGGDLPEHRRQSGFDNLDFAFFDRGTSDGLRCAAAIDLPDYDIASITTGQYNNQGQIWQNEIHPTP